jgi:hypothetical protein
MEDLKRLEDRILARIQELEANVAELEQLREVAARLGILDGDRRDSAPATRRATATTRARRPARSSSSGTAGRSGGARSSGTAGRSGGGRSSGTAGRSGGARSTTGGRATHQMPRHVTRRERVLQVVGDEPGISVREVVAALGVNRTSLDPVVRQLVSDGLLHKDGRGLWPVPS